MKAKARHTDPMTSHEAAESTDPTKLERLVLNVIQSYGTKGAIHDDVWYMIVDYKPWKGITKAMPREQSITPRYAPLLRKGLIKVEGKRKGQSGKNQQVMIATHIPPEPPIVGMCHE